MSLLYPYPRFSISSGEVGPNAFLSLREAVLFLAQSDTFHKEDHVPCKYSHYLSSLIVNVSLAGFPAVDVVPVLARSDRHVAKSKELVELVKSCGAA